MKSQTLDELLNKIDELNQIHLSSRGILQYVNESKIGQNKINWNSKIPSNRFEVEFKFQNPISQQTRSELNIISDYMNQNFIVRLHSLLEFEEIKNDKIKIDKEIEGHEMINFIHLLRKEFAHKTGKYNKDSKDSTRLREDLFAYFNISSSESLSNQFPLDKNRVIKPIVDGTKKYVESFWKKYK